jgi:hypothetical protein
MKLKKVYTGLINGYSCSFSFFQMCGVGAMVFNATFNNISVIWWHSVLLVEETGVPG